MFSLSLRFRSSFSQFTMRRKLQLLGGFLKDKTSFARSVLLSPYSSCSAAELAILRATAHHPPSLPPHPRHIDALLSFSRGAARPVAAALVSFLSSRILSTSDPVVALKSLLTIHFLLRSSPFILLDQLSSSVLPHPSAGRCPLFLSSFPLGADPLSWSLSSCVRWYSRLLELLLLLPPSPSDPQLSQDRASSLLTGDLTAEIDALITFIEGAYDPPEMPSAVGNKLVAEVERMVAGECDAVEQGILVRIRESQLRIRSVRFGEVAELARVMSRIEGCCRPLDWKRKSDYEEGLWREVGLVREMLEKAVARMKEDGLKLKERTAAGE